jgi:hypothetical protein
VRYGVIEQMRQQYPVPPMCRFLYVPLTRIRETFGPERLKELADRGVQIGVTASSVCARSSDFVASKNASSRRQQIRRTTCQSHRIYWTKILVRANRTRRGAATSPMLRPMRDGFIWLVSMICLALR